MDVALATRVKDLLRRDLRLGADAEIADDMPLIGGEFDLDSLDVVMLMNSIEKHFGVKLARDGSAEALFAGVDTIVAHLSTLQEAGGDAAGAGPNMNAAAAGPGEATPATPADRAAPDLAAILDRLPHRAPFRFVTALTTVDPGVSATARWELSGDESFFVGHFPGAPIVPGVLLTEALAQTAGLVLAAEEDPDAAPGGGRLASANVRFRASVPPPATVELVARRGAGSGGIETFEVTARVGGNVVAEGSLTLAIS